MRRMLGLPSGVVRVVARVLLLALSVTTLGPMLHAAHDPECEPAYVLHDESQHHFQADPLQGASSHADHCLGCHFVRSFRGAVSWTPSGVIALTSGTLLFSTDIVAAASASVAPRPARAPPIA